MKYSAEIGLQDKLSLNATACLTIRRPDAACTICADACPAQAVAIDARMIELDHDRCTRCARCVALCPTGALDLPLPLDHNTEVLILECSRVPMSDQHKGAQVVRCLGGVSANQLLDALAEGARPRFVDRGWCLDCPSGGCAAPWADVVQSVQADLSRLDQDTDTDQLLVITAPLPTNRAQAAPQSRRPETKAYSRRQLFRRLTTPAAAPDRSRVTDAQPFSGKVDAPALEMRRNALHVLHAADSLPANLFPALDCARTPDMRLAVSLCPTHALRLLETPEADALVFNAALCIACRDCEKADGLHLRAQGEGFYQGPVTLARQTMADCPGCQRRFAPRDSQRECDACHKDNDIAAAAFGLMRRTQAPYGA